MFTLGSRASLENTDRLITSGRTYSSSPQDCRDQALGGEEDQDGRSLQQGINHDYFRGKWGTTCNRSR